MAGIPLTPFPVDINGPLFQAISKWRLEKSEEFVSRILTDDIPQRIKYEQARIWAYRDPDKNIVGFGTLSLCNDLHEFTEGTPLHTYIPLLAVHPDQRGFGHGRTILEHLVGEAAALAAERSDDVSHFVFLDVYEDSKDAIGLYHKCGFQRLGSGPLMDPANGEAFWVMAKRIK